MRITHSHDVLRKRLESRLYYTEINSKPGLESLKETEWSPRFEQYMRNRLVIGAIRYELFETKRQSNNYSLLSYIEAKVKEYRVTNNQECLVDLANVAMIEFECPTVPNPHFTPEDDTSHVQED